MFLINALTTYSIYMAIMAYIEAIVIFRVNTHFVLIILGKVSLLACIGPVKRYSLFHIHLNKISKEKSTISS